MTEETFQTRLGAMKADWADGALSGLNFWGDDTGVEFSSAPSDLARRVQAQFCGDNQDFRDVPLDLSGVTPFAAKVYAAAQQVPPGRTASYGEIATAVGSPGGARAVGGALGRNPFLLVVPCHRILAHGTGKMGGFSAPGGLLTKTRMLAAEGYGVESFFEPQERSAGLALLAADPDLGPIMAAVGPCELQARFADRPFAALARSVLYQQLATTAAHAIELRVRALAPPFPGPEQFLAFSEEILRGAGLSRPKIATLRALSAAVIDGSFKLEELPLLPDADVVSEVSQIKGLGSWTAEMFLMFHLGRRDLLPVKDLGIRKAMARVFGLKSLPNPAQMERRARAWRPYRSLASWYLWRSLELPEDLAPAGSGQWDLPGL